MGMIGFLPGTVVAKRFFIEEAASQGGMGTVYRSRDLQSGGQVAVKLMHTHCDSEAHARRFTREAELLAELRHPSIVAYLDHGHTYDGWSFLAMEWLEGEELGQRLRRSRLTLSESLTLLRDVASALAIAHRRGIVHRDLKPSNLYLRDGQLGRVTLLDFGIARQMWASAGLTRVGDVIGTPRYMAPEQAQGRQDISPACDVYSLGCVLFECLTGQVPIEGKHPAAVLTKILFQEAPLLRTLRPDLPAPLEGLLQRMLAKLPARRPADADALLAELDALPAMTERPAPGCDATTGEQGLELEEAQLVSVVIAGCGAFGTLAARAVELPMSLDDQPPPAERSELRRALSVYGGQVELLIDGSAVVTLAQTHKSTATDQAMQAARCALALKERWPDAQVVVTTGRGVLAAQVPLGEAIDRAWRLLGAHSLGSDPGSSPVLLDEVTAGLLDTRFELSPMPTGNFALRGERAEIDPARPLLGKPTPCLGRDRELAMLEGLLQECREESAPRVVLVTAPPGMGKSRLRHELVRRLQSRGEPLKILIGRGDPLSAGTPYGLLAQALRRLCGIVDGEPLAERRARLAERVRRQVSGPEVDRMIEFLGELCEIHFPDEASVQLHAARQDPHIMSDRISQAALDFLKALGEQKPLLLILEDLHWGDGLTVRLLDTALRQLRTTPLLILALARPEVEDLFPRLWKDRQRQDLRLEGLTAKASAQLVRKSLGEPVAEATLARIVKQAGGNALYLEELIRAEAAGKGEALPKTVLVMLQARLMRLPAGARFALRVASVYGQTFWRGGLQADDVDSWLQILINAEFIERHRSSRFPDDVEYSFRHALLREAAYSFLSTDEQRQWHRQAAHYLQRAGEQDPAVLAEHFQRSGELTQAIINYAQAAEQAYERNDLEETLRRVDRGLDCSAQGELRGTLYALKTAALFLRNELERALHIGTEALTLLEPGTADWYRAIGFATGSAAALGKRSEVSELARRFGNLPPPAAPMSSYFETASLLATMLGLIGDREMAELFLSHSQGASGLVTELSPSVHIWTHYALGRHASALQPAPWSAVYHFQVCLDAAMLIGDRRQIAICSGDLGFALARIGQSAAAEARLREGVQVAAQLGEPITLVWVQMYLTLLLAESRDEAAQNEAMQLARDILGTLGEESYYSGIVHCALAALHSAAGRLDEAEAVARKAVKTLGPTRSSAPLAFIALTQVLLRAGRPAEAAQVAGEGVRLAESLGGSGGSEVPLRRALVQSLRACGAAQAESAQVELALQITSQAAQIPDPALRASFLARVEATSGAIPIF